jgi:hypothetical protein
MSGMGGGVVLIPALTFLGVDIKHVIAASVLSVIATSSGSAAAFVRGGLTNLKVATFMEVFTVLGAIVGAWLTLALAPRVLVLAFGVVLSTLCLMLLARGRLRLRPAPSQDALSRWLELDGRYDDFTEHDTIEYHAVRAHIGGPLILGAGVIAGLLGIGGGALKVLINDLIMGLPPEVSATTSNLTIGVTALAAASVYLAAGQIDPNLTAALILGVGLGALIGTRVLARETSEIVHRLFMGLLIVIGLEMVWRGIRGM